MNDDLRLAHNVFASPQFQEATPPPDGAGVHPVDKILDARYGLIQSAERVFLFGLLCSLRGRHVRAVEIGTWRGTTMHVLRRACDELYCIDPQPQWIWDPSLVTRSGQPVQLITGFSPAALDKVPQPFTFVFVDGDHSRDGVYRDARALEPLMESGGVICFHDANHPSVQQGMLEAEREWKRPHRFHHLACDTISQTPDGIFGGLSVIVVEPDRYGTGGATPPPVPSTTRLRPFFCTQIAAQNTQP